MKKKFAFFDFDGTIIPGDSIINFLSFMRKNKQMSIGQYIKSIFLGLFYLLGLIDAKECKEKCLSFINGMSRAKLNPLCKQFIDDCLSSKIYNDAVLMIEQLKSDGYKIVVVSASNYFYTKELKHFLSIDEVIGTNMIIKNDIYSNKIDGKNCKGQEKVHRINAYLDKLGEEIDFERSVSFGDSNSDLYMMSLTKNKYFINSRKKLKNRFKNENNYHFLSWK